MKLLDFNSIEKQTDKKYDGIIEHRKTCFLRGLLIPFLVCTLMKHNWILHI
jgi:hypothetical protein